MLIIDCRKYSSVDASTLEFPEHYRDDDYWYASKWVNAYRYIECDWKSPKEDQIVQLGYMCAVSENGFIEDSVDCFAHWDENTASWYYIINPDDVEDGDQPYVPPEEEKVEKPAAATKPVAAAKKPVDTAKTSALEWGKCTKCGGVSSKPVCTPCMILAEHEASCTKPAPLVWGKCTKCGGVSSKPVCITCTIVAEYEAAQAKKK